MRKAKDVESEEGSNIDAVQHTGRRHGRIMSLVADGVRRSTGQEGKEAREDDEEDGQERKREGRCFAKISLFLLAQQ